MIKTFEQFNDLDPYSEENWDDKHGNIGIGDRIVSKDRYTYNKKGKVYDYFEALQRFLIYFDEEVWNEIALINSKIEGADRHGIPQTHAMWIEEKDLVKIDE